VLSFCSFLRNPLLKPTGVLEHCREEETNCRLSIFISDSIPNVSTDVSVRFFIHSSNSCKLYERIPGTFEGAAYYICRQVWFVVVTIDIKRFQY
jgi:hypothetical protein